jgi:lipopolysaccharide export system protein LptA
VVDKDSATFVYNGGQYDTKSRRSDLAFGTAETQEYKLEALGYQLDDVRKLYKLRGNVVMTSKKDDVIIYGQSADYYKSDGLSKVYDNAYLAKITDDNDTLFISADTLVSIESQEPGKKRLLAYHNVKIYKSDLQGVTDSLEYRIADSTIYFYRQPVLWNEGNQMTADSIRMLIKGKTIDRMFLNVNSFVINRDSLFNFNQIKGREMVVEFKDASIYRVYVEGNGESIFYALDEKTAAMTGVNRIICSNITIRFKDGRVNNMSFYVQPEARFIPPHELRKDEETLPGFRWQETEKPIRRDVVKPQIHNSGGFPDRKRLLEK